jgi:methionyl-tRNA formyltransferase
LFDREIRAGEIAPFSVRNSWRALSDHELGISCHSKQIFPASLVQKVRCINIHPGFNPYNRGWYPQVYSLINKLPLGVTIHEMDPKIDHGPIICQVRVEVYDWDTSLTVYQRLLQKEVDLVLKWLPVILTGEYTATSPVEEGNYNSKADFENICEIDLAKAVTFKEAIDFLRAMSHAPYFNAFYKSGAKKVWIRVDLSLDSGDRS